jgi:hypothetical protein
LSREVFASLLDLFYSWKELHKERWINIRLQYLRGNYKDFGNYFSINWHNNEFHQQQKAAAALLRPKLINHASEK